MATQAELDKENADQQRVQRQREALGNAYAALLGQQSVQSFTAFTFEEALDAQIESIEGKGTALRPNQLGRVDKIEQEAKQAIAQLKSTAPEEFLEADSEEDVNTPLEEQG